MDRRRFVPSPDGLEGRALMSLFGGSASSAKKNLNITIQNLPENFQQKTLRIEHLPFYLEQTSPGRPLPQAALKQLQADLTEIAGNLHAPSTQAVTTFNTGLRHVFPYRTLNATSARYLNNSFAQVLDKAGATSAQVESLRADLNSIAKADSHNTDPTFLVANDYSLVLQTALSVGRPIPTPDTPSIDTKDGIRVKTGPAGVTHKETPSLVGTYSPGATKDGFTTIQILNENSHVVGSGVVDKNGAYSAKLTVPLPVGINHLRARAVDLLGHESLASKSFMLKFTPRPGTVVTAHSSTLATNSTEPMSPTGGPTSLL